MTLERIIGYCNWIRYPHGSAIFLLNTPEFDCVLDLSWLNWLHMYMSQFTVYQVLFSMGCDSTIFAHVYIVCRRATQMIDGRLSRIIIHSHSGGTITGCYSSCYSTERQGSPEKHPTRHRSIILYIPFLISSWRLTSANTETTYMADYFYMSRIASFVNIDLIFLSMVSIPHHRSTQTD